MNTTMTRSFRGMTGAAVLAAALSLTLIGPHSASAAPRPLASPGANDLGVTILSPDPRVPLAGLKPVEISAFYQGSPANQIVAIELFIDGAKAATKTLDVPETRGVVSFLIDAGQISAGNHLVVVRATAADQEVQSAKSRFTFNGMDNEALSSPTPSGPETSLPTNPALSSGLPPTLRLISPTEDGRVQGTITLKVEASDPSGKAPYVSLFIDKTFKTLRNYAPYEFEWDTTAYSNGYHTIEAYGYNDSTNVGHTKSLRLYVNNPGGETQIRHDLLDAPATVKAAPVAAAPKKYAARRISAALPPALMASLMPSHLQTTTEIVRQLASGAGSLRFGKLGFASELSTPFAADKPTVRTEAARPVRLRAFKPLPAAKLDLPKIYMAPAELAQMLAQTHSSDKRTPGPQMASVRLPGSDLASPFAAMPHIAPLSASAAKVAAYRAEARMGRGMRVRGLFRGTPTEAARLKLHTLRVRLPQGMDALLRSVGQRTVLFNHSTVMMDRPLTVQNRVLFGPLRQIFEQGGGQLTWQSYNGTVRAKNATKDILLTLGSRQAQVNAKQVTLDGKPYLMMGRTMVPLSFIALALDATVQFDAVSGHLLVTSK